MDYSDRYDPETDFDSWYSRAAAEVIIPLVRPGDRVLELGCATGLMTAEFAGAGATVVAVEQSGEYLGRARARHLENVEWIQANLDAWQPAVDAKSFDHVVMTNLIHEVSLPARLLAIAASSLAPKGLAHLSLQNPLSVHRQVGKAMGLVEDVTELSPLGRELGAHGLFTAETLQSMALGAGLRTVFHRGLVLKPLPNDLMSKLPPELVRGLVDAAIAFPQLCSMTYLLLSAATPPSADSLSRPSPAR